MALPTAIYLETNTLWGVAHRRDNPSLRTLVKYTEAVGTSLFTTALVIEELAQKYKEELRVLRSALESARDDFSARRFILPTVNWPEPIDDVIERLPQAVRENLESYGLTVIPNQHVDQERLLRMSVTKELPFTEKGEKGFRDTIIVLTILGHAHAGNFVNLMIVTHDKAIIDSMGTLPEANGHVIEIAHDIDAAVKHIRTFISEFFRDYEATRKVACREAVLRERGRVEEFIQQHGVYPETLFRNGLAPFESVASVESAVLADVQVAAVGDLPQGTAEGRVQVTLEAKLDAKIKTSRLFWPSTRRFRVGGEVEEDALTSAIRRRQPEDARTISIQVELEGSIQVRTAANGEEFSDLRLDAFNPPNRLFQALLAGLIESPSPPPAD